MAVQAIAPIGEQERDRQHEEEAKKSEVCRDQNHRVRSDCVVPKRTLFFTWMRFDHVFENFSSTRKLPPCVSDFRHELCETTKSSRFHNFGFQELSRELFFRIEQSMSTT